MASMETHISEEKAVISDEDNWDLPIPGVDHMGIKKLNLPASSTDLLIDNHLVLDALTVYEALLRFTQVVRLSPFTFEQFCASLADHNYSNLMNETFSSLLKLMHREEDALSTWFGPADLRDSTNNMLFQIDTVTWPSILREYLRSEANREFDDGLEAMDDPDFPLGASIEDKLVILKALVNVMLGVSYVSKELDTADGDRPDDHCRRCNKLGELILCDGCNAVYHPRCADPPIHMIPEGEWTCHICKKHLIEGVVGCQVSVSEAVDIEPEDDDEDTTERKGAVRHECIALDRNGRRYFFIARRLVVDATANREGVFIYSTVAQFRFITHLLDKKFEPKLVRRLNDLSEDIVRLMNVTASLTRRLNPGNVKSALEVDAGLI